MAVLKRQNENLDEGFFTKEYESGQFKNGDEKPFVDAIKKGGGKNIDVTKPDRREPMLTIEFDDGDVKKIKSLISKVGDGTEDVEEAVSPAQQAAIAISKKERGEKPKEEGNAFGKELKAARDKGEKTFVVSGKKYNVEDYDVKEDLDEAKFSDGMIDKLRKAYEPLRGKKIPPGPLMKIFDKIDKDKNALIQLYKADIPFVSQMAVSRLISKHKMKGVEINKLREDAPTNNASSGAVDMNPTGMSLKKKKELDARTKEYKIHAEKLMAQREKRKLKAQKSICGSFRKNVKENTDNFSREEFIQEDNVAILRKIVKDKRNMPIKLKDGQMKVDLYTASAFVQTLDNKTIKPATKKKLEFLINKGNKSQFLRTVDAVFRQSSNV